MSPLPHEAKVVIIGAGIVGNSIAYHLSLKGWKNLVLLDKGKLPKPGGSTGHASNFLYPVDHSKEMTQMTLDSIRQYRELGIYQQSGGFEVARSEERLEELKRRMMSAKSFGVESYLLSPAEIKEMVPYINEKILVGGFYVPMIGIAHSPTASTIMRDRAVEMGALSVHDETEVLGLTVEQGQIKGVTTDKGYIEAEYVVISCGIWAPRIARMAGAFIPNYPAVHQMISVGPIPFFKGAQKHIEYPIVRDMDSLMYNHQTGEHLHVGSYAHRAIVLSPDEIPSLKDAKLSPTEMPFTPEDFAQQMIHAKEIIPELLTEEISGKITYAINGLLSLTPDGHPVLGETPEVKNLWSANAVWVKEGPGVGRMIAEWMVDGHSEIDPHHSDIARFYEYGRSTEFVRSRATEGFIKTYGIIHPREQWKGSRNLRVSPYFARQQELGAFFFQAGGWERPMWYESNAHLLETYKDQILWMPHEWDGRWWSPIVQAEHLAMRDGVAMIDLSAFGIFDVVGAGALSYMENMAVAKMDVPVGKAIYTPILDTNGGFRSDLTIMRLGTNHFRVVTGATDIGRDLLWFRRHLPADGSVQIIENTSRFSTLGLWGPKAREVLQAITADDVSNEAFPYGTTKEITIRHTRVLAMRISYVGELGWELYVPFEQGMALWNVLEEAGKEHGILPVGIGVYGTTARIEKGYRLVGAELDSEYNVVEAGLNRAKVKDADFIGKQAYLAHRAQTPAALLCTLTVDDLTSPKGNARYPMSFTPVLTLDGEPITDDKGRRSFVTSAGVAPSMGKHLLMAYLPPQYAVEGTSLKVEYFGDHYPVTVAVVGSRSLFDPTNERMKA